MLIESQFIPNIKDINDLCTNTNVAKIILIVYLNILQIYVFHRWFTLYILYKNSKTQTFYSISFFLVVL